ncbi:MAG: HEPN domain-containing protein [archaeon]|nr:HEPN domain-containing protein [archaeon]
MRNDVEVWLKQAKRDLKSAKNSLISGDYYVTALLCQQAVEKSLKYHYLQKNKDLLRIHDLVKLAREVGAPDNIIKACAEINPVYVEVRYPEGNELPFEKVNKKEAEYILKLTEIILQWIQKN